MPTFESRPFSSRVVGAGDSKIHNCITKGNGTVCTQKKMKAIDEMACNQCLAFCKGSSLRAPNNLEIPAHCFAYQIHISLRDILLPLFEAWKESCGGIFSMIADSRDCDKILRLALTLSTA